MHDTSAYLDDFVAAVRGLDQAVISEMVLLLAEARKRGRTVFVCGNGGSAASASHFATDLAKLTAASPGARRMRVLALTESVSAISAIGNDLAFEEIFVEQLKPWVQAGDVVLGFSTSGVSPNVVRAIEYGNLQGAVTLAITGRAGGPLAHAAQLTLRIDSTSVQQVEDATMVAAHLVCLQLRQLVLDLPASVPHLQAGGNAFHLPVV